MSTGLDPKEQLQAGAHRLGLELTPGQRAAFDRYAAELAEWNARVRLVGSAEPAELYVRHFLDSLTILPALPAGPLSIVDVGAGAGFPGVPLALVRSDISLTLIESVGKKATFLRHLAEALALPQVTVLQARAEEIARDPAQREGYAVAVARALAELATALELCLPLVRVGGLCVAMKKGDAAGEVAAAASALEALGGRLRESRDAGLPDLLPGHMLVVVEKIAPTPTRYPRRAGMPAKRPL